MLNIAKLEIRCQIYHQSNVNRFHWGLAGGKGSKSFFLQEEGVFNEDNREKKSPASGMIGEYTHAQLEGGHRNLGTWARRESFYCLHQSAVPWDY